jgi:hypothetical protein
MTRREFEADFASILNMIRDHSFLQYQEATVQEYRSKVEAAATHFRTIVRDCTGFLPERDNVLEREIERTRTPTIASACHILERTAALRSSLKAEEDQAESVRLRRAADMLKRLH